MSRNDAWFPLYIGDYLGDTRSLSTIEHGAYLLLLMEYWRKGPLPPDDKSLATIAGVNHITWSRNLRKNVLKFFTLGSDGSLHQKRMDIERAKVLDISKKRRKAAFVSHGKEPPADHTEPSQLQLQEQPHVHEQLHMQVPADSRAGPLQSQRKKESKTLRALDSSFPPLASLARANPDEVEAAVEAWNAKAAEVGLTQVQRLTTNRKAKLRQRLRECGGLEGWQEALRIIGESPFLVGQRGPWKADFDFVISADKFVKLMEGGFSNEGQAPTARPPRPTNRPAGRSRRPDLPED